ncbi:hypothetical protein CEXT_227351 [Caerostris extrusa]|uniref:Uncharacterized protein n=1 Tax=Caerostris extrusa TaxID=172846 RepID=A0AAV4XMD7_CAEEX|nr:hypothetical protein CEXT_227351 [Caerostris extrusa]
MERFSISRSKPHPPPSRSGRGERKELVPAVVSPPRHAVDRERKNHNQESINKKDGRGPNPFRGAPSLSPEFDLQKGEKRSTWTNLKVNRKNK